MADRFVFLQSLYKYIEIKVINMKKITFCLVFVAGLCVVSCSSDDVMKDPEPVICPVEAVYAEGEDWSPASAKPEARKDYEAISLSSEEKEMIARQNEFALNVFRELSRIREYNTLFSPVSLSLNLSMLANGADGATLEELSAALGSSDGLNALNKKLIDGLVSADKTSRISIANSIWVRPEFDLLEEFVRTNCDNYYADIFRRNLSLKATMDEINAWVEENTSGIIKNMLDKPLEDVVPLTLANAVYFYGSWVNSFDKEFTKEESFNNLGGDLSKVEMMRYSQNEIVYSENDFARAAYLPFGNGAYEMTLILPNKDVDFEAAMSSLTVEAINGLQDRKEDNVIPLSVPKFEVLGDITLKSAMTAVGYGKIFEESADFSRINPQSPLYIGDIIQKSKIKVDEEGAEGAAATLEIMCTSPGPDVEIPTMYFNRPFIFLLTEKSSGAILFVGNVKKL